MSNITALSDLAKFVAKSPLASQDENVRKAAINELVAGISPKVATRRSTDLLGVVMALSARTRRIVQPKVDIDLDVFGPNGKRAVYVISAA